MQLVRNYMESYVIIGDLVVWWENSARLFFAKQVITLIYYQYIYLYIKFISY